MTFFNSVIPAKLFLSSRPTSRDLPNSLTQLKWPFHEIPAQKQTGMTSLLMTSSPLKANGDDFFNSVILAKYIRHPGPDISVIPAHEPGSHKQPDSAQIAFS